MKKRERERKRKREKEREKNTAQNGGKCGKKKKKNPITVAQL